jgi:hypothetical protein
MIDQGPYPAAAHETPTTAPASTDPITRSSRLRNCISRVSSVLWTVPAEVMRKLSESAWKRPSTFGSP